jgi:hypothetical protein
MGKRSNFKRVKADAYDTPREAVRPLLPHLRRDTSFIEACAGKGDLIRWLELEGHHCIAAFDVRPRQGDWLGEIYTRDLLEKGADDLKGSADCFITNPPWSRDLLHGIIVRLAVVMPTWLLFDSDWAYTLQARPFLPLLHKIVAVGRVQWIPGSAYTSKDNAAWHLFGQPRMPSATIEFHGRGPT